MILETKREKEIAQQILHLKEEVEDIKSRKTIKCDSCEKRTPINKVLILKKYQYESPYGCTGGDYWSFGNEYKWWCDKCGTWERAYTVSSYATKSNDKYEFIHNHINYFGEVLDLYREETIQEIRNNMKKRQRGY